jgi:hypothetical protein
MSSFSVENAAPGAVYNNLFGTDIGAGLANRSINASNTNGAGDDFSLVERHELRQGVVTLSVKVNVGTYTLLDVALQAWDGQQWVTLASMTDDLGGSVSANIEGYRRFRANKIAGTAAASATITAYLGFN